MEDKSFPKDTSLRADGRQQLVRVEEFQGKLEAAAAWPGRVPLVLVPTAYPRLTEVDIAALGKVGIVIYGNHAIRAAVGAMRSVFAQIRKDGGIREVDRMLPSVQEIIRLQGDAQMRAVESSYLR